MFSQNCTINPGNTSTVDPVRRSVLRKLSRIEKLVLTLTYHEGLSLRETGVVLGLSETQARETLAGVEEKFSRVTSLSTV